MKNTLIDISNIGSFVGVEFCIFSLKDGASEEDMIRCSSNLEQKFLSSEDGFLGHSVLKGKDGLYVDLTFATSQEKAEAICGKWMENKFALKYLEFIDSESVNLSFWARIK